jgi:anti-sigma regulatory factor (Ser/Thr protein kinase)
VHAARTTLPPEPGSAGVARRWAALFCEAAGAPEHAELTALLVSELVTNAIVHGRSETTVEVVIDDLPGGGSRVQVTVSDGDSRLPRFSEDVPVDALGGRGLAILAGLAPRYGVTELAEGKAVWFELLPQ